jgi:hypothetical protein
MRNSLPCEVTFRVVAQKRGLGAILPHLSRALVLIVNVSLGGARDVLWGT